MIAPKPTRRCLACLPLLVLGSVLSAAPAFSHDADEHSAPSSATPHGTNAYDLTNYPPTPETSDLAKITAEVRVDTIQKSQKGGIQLTLRLENAGKQKVTFNNPLDLLDVIVLDKEGYPLYLPRVPRRVQGHGKAIMLPFQYGPLKIEAKTLTREETESFTVTLAPGEVLEVPVEVDKVFLWRAKPITNIPTQGRVGTVSSADFRPPADMKPVSVPSGSYKVQVMLLLAQSTEKQRPMQSPLIPVTFTAGDAAATR